jgi:DNA-binding NarL/FixJ family response regulator
MSDQRTPPKETGYCMGRTSFSGMKRTKVLLADDHKIVLDGLRNLLEPEFMLIGAVEDGRALLFAVQQLHPDVIVVDISMPLLNGIDAVRQIKKIDNQVKVIFLTMHADVTYAIRAFEVGASGYVLKHASSSELRIAIHAAIKGQTYVSPMIAGELFQVYKGETYQQVKEAPPLTMRQSEIIQLLVEGCSAKEIANILNISSRTVEFHKHNVMLKLKLKTNSGLIKYAIKNGFTAVEGLKDGISS